jgi:3-oxoacyl-[acyl-carrier protein] reductase
MKRIRKLSAPLDSLVVLITGAGRGIGRGIALACARRGARVVVTDVTVADAQAVVADIDAIGGSAVALACDATSRPSVEAAVAGALGRYGRLDCVVHNATSRYSPVSEPLDEIVEAHWGDLVAVGPRGAFLLATVARPHLAASGGSLLLLISNAAYHGAPDLPAYSAVKGALRGMVKALAREWGPAGIRVNGLSPLAMTPALEDYLARYPEAEAPLLDRAALRRFGHPEDDIGTAATLLIGRDARFITGQTLIADGGGVMP